MTALTSYNWQAWKIGIMGALISGASNGLVAMTIGVSFKKTLILIGVSAAVSLGKYLQMNPAPPPSST